MESNTVKTQPNELEDDKVTRLPVENARDEGTDGEGKPDYLRDVTGHSSKDGSSLGADLRLARKKLGEDVQTIATALNIRASHLEALERGDVSALPGRAYALGFVRSYAGYLGLDAEASVARFKLETDRQEEEAAALAFPEANEDVRMPQGSLTVIALLLVAAILGGLQLSQMVDSMLTNDAQQPDAAETVAPATETVPAEAATTLGASVAPQPADGIVDGELTAETPDASASSSEDAGSVAAIEAGESSVTEAPQQVQPNAPVADNQAFGASPSESRVSILANGNAWLRIDNPRTGAVLIQTTMRKGDRFFVPDEDGLVMAARNSKNLEIFVDGASLGPAGVGVLVEKSLNADLLISPAD